MVENNALFGMSLLLPHNVLAVTIERSVICPPEEYLSLF
jgi:hypothetical protein